MYFVNPKSHTRWMHKSKSFEYYDDFIVFILSYMHLVYASWFNVRQYTKIESSGVTTVAVVYTKNRTQFALRIAECFSFFYLKHENLISKNHQWRKAHW